MGWLCRAISTACCILQINSFRSSILPIFSNRHRNRFPRLFRDITRLKWSCGVISTASCVRLIDSSKSDILPLLSNRALSWLPRLLKCIAISGWSCGIVFTAWCVSWVDSSRSSILPILSGSLREIMRPAQNVEIPMNMQWSDFWIGQITTELGRRNRNAIEIVTLVWEIYSWANVCISEIYLHLILTYEEKTIASSQSDLRISTRYQRLWVHTKPSNLVEHRKIAEARVARKYSVNLSRVRLWLHRVVVNGIVYLKFTYCCRVITFCFPFRMYSICT